MPRLTAACVVLVALCLHATATRAEVQVHPSVGFVVPTSPTRFTVDGVPDFTASGTSAFGLDLEILFGESGWRPTASYWHDGGSATNDELNYTERGNSVSLGVCRSVRLGLGSLAIGVEAARRSWSWVRSDSFVGVATFEDSQTLFLASLRLSAPMSDAICLNAVAKYQATAAVHAQVVADTGAEVEMQAAGKAFVLAMGLGWRFGGF